VKNSELTKSTIGHYEQDPEAFKLGTLDHDISQNYQAFLDAISSTGPSKILDLGCGPGRDLKYFKSLNHTPIGLDGCESFCEMARSYSECEVLLQDFIDLKLENNYFDGIFANASLFHVPKTELPQVIGKLRKSLKSAGILFSSNPRGNSEGFSGMRYGNYMELEEYKIIIEDCGFTLLNHYYRPQELPLEQRPWLACVFKNSFEESI
jgi:SAM-dependent methyltransferase